MSQALSGTAPIKVEDLIKRIKTELLKEAEPPRVAEDALEEAFLKFY